MEFRGYVSNGNLNALSQYNFLVHFPDLIKEKNEIVEKIKQFHKNVIHNKLKHKFSSYVIDFAITGNKIWVIELNPFLSSTDGALFSWNTERNLLENGPFEARFVEKPPAGAKALLANSWREILENS